MYVSRFVAAVLAVIFSAPIVVSAAPLCATVVSPAGSRDAIARFWESNQPVRFGSRRNSYLTFSHDSEIRPEALIKFLYSVEGGEKALRDYFPEKEFKMSALEAELNLTERQIRTFHLKEAAKTKRSNFKVTDLKVSAAAQFFANNRSYNETSEKKFISFVTTHLNRRGLKVTAEFDNKNLELHTKNWETIPSEFRQRLLTLHEIFPGLMSHLHLGIPRAAGDKEGLKRSIAVGRAVETMLVLDFARAGIEDNELSFNMGTLLLKDAGKEQIERGVIKFEPEGFDKPVVSDNLEIRQWDDIQHGLFLLGSAVRLALNGDRLRAISESALQWRNFQLDPYVGNIAGALKYAAYMLENQRGQDRLARKLAALQSKVAREITSAKSETDKLSLRLRAAIAEVFTDVEFDDLFNSDLFLKTR